MQYKDIINLSFRLVDYKNQIVESEIMKILNDLNISKENMPDFDSEYKYYTKQKDGHDKIYLIFVPETKKLYVIEDKL